MQDLLGKIMRGEPPTAADMALLPYVLMLPLTEEQDKRVSAMFPGVRPGATQAEHDGLIEAFEGRRRAPAGESASTTRQRAATPNHGTAAASGTAMHGAAAAAAPSSSSAHRSPEVAKALAAFERLAADAAKHAAAAGTHGNAAEPSVALPLRSPLAAVAMLFHTLALAATGHERLVLPEQCKAFVDLAREMGPIVDALAAHRLVDKASADLLTAAMPQIQSVLPFLNQVKLHTAALDVPFIVETLNHPPESKLAGAPLDPAASARLASRLMRGYDHVLPETWLSHIERHRKLIRHAQTWQLISPAQHDDLAAKLDRLAAAAMKFEVPPVNPSPRVDPGRFEHDVSKQPLRLDQTNIVSVANEWRNSHGMSDEQLAELRQDIRGYHLSSPGALSAEAFDKKYENVLQGHISASERRVAFGQLTVEISKLLAEKPRRPGRTA